MCENNSTTSGDDEPLWLSEPGPPLQTYDNQAGAYANTLPSCNNQQGPFSYLKFLQYTVSKTRCISACVYFYSGLGHSTLTRSELGRPPKPSRHRNLCIALSVLITIISLLLFVCLILSSTVPNTTSLGAKNIYGHELEELVSNFSLMILGERDGFKFNKVSKNDNNQISIYIKDGEHLLTKHRTLKEQGAISSGSRAVVARYYLVSQSNISVTLALDSIPKDDEKQCIAELVLFNNLNDSVHFVKREKNFASSCVFPAQHTFFISNYSSNYYIGIDARVDLKFTISGEIYYYDIADLSLGCSISGTKTSCSILQPRLREEATQLISVFALTTTLNVANFTSIEYEIIEYNIPQAIAWIPLALFLLLFFVIGTIICCFALGKSCKSLLICCLESINC